MHGGASDDALRSQRPPLAWAVAAGAMPERCGDRSGHPFNAEGVAGLDDRPRCGRPRLQADELHPELATWNGTAWSSTAWRTSESWPSVTSAPTTAAAACMACSSRWGCPGRPRARSIPNPIPPPRRRLKNFPDQLAAIARRQPGKRLEVCEARVGQKGTLTRLWAPRAIRVRAVRDHRFKSADIFGAVCPQRDTGVALVMTRVSTEAMTLMPAEISQAVCRPRRTPSSCWTGPAGTSPTSWRCRPT